MRFFTILPIILFASFQLNAQTVSYSTSGATITQNFNSLPSSGTNVITSTPNELSGSPVNASAMGGWYLSSANGTVNGLNGGTGTGIGGGAYNFGATSSTERALGSLASNSVSPRFGVLLTNNTGTTLTSFTVNFTAEQWRNGGSNAVDSMVFSYKVGATNVNDASGFTLNSSGNLKSSITSSTAGALDGNLSANQKVVSVTISSISWADGAVLGLRWDDVNKSGNDDALAIDDWSFSATAGPVLPTVSLGLSTSTASEAAATVVTLTATSSVAVVGDQTVDIVVSGTGITAGDYTLSGPTITILNGQTSGTATFTVVDDILVEGVETATIALTNPSVGITLSAAASQTVSIADNDGDTYYSRASGLHTAAIWSLTPMGVAGTAVFNDLNNFVIQSGHTVTLNTSGVDMKNLTVDAGGKFYINNNATNRYLNVWGNVTNNGVIGSGGGNDGISFNIEGPSCTISGSGVTDLARMRKNTNANSITNLVIDQNVNLRFSGAAFYNNASAEFNVTINSGDTLYVMGSNFTDGSFAIDGTNGVSGTASTGVVNVNGALVVSNLLYAIANNGSGNTGININSGGEVLASIVNLDVASGASPFVLDVKAGGKLYVGNALNLIAGAFNPTGTVTLLSTSDVQCAIVNNFTSGYTGSVTSLTAQRYVPDAGFNQHFISSPIANTSFSDIGAVSGADNVFVTPTVSCDENALEAGSNYGNFFEWSEANVGGACILNGWKVKSAGTLDAAKGYSAYLNGNAIFDVTGVPNQGVSYATPVTRGTWATTTTLQGNSYQSGWNLVGNPFLTTVNLATKADIDNDVKIYNTTGPYQGTYSTLFAGSGAAFIAPFQGFYVRKSSNGTGSYAVTKAECAATPATFNKNGENVLKVIVSGNGFKDKTNIAFEALATKDYDNGYDAVKFVSKGGQPSIYTMIDDVKAEYNVANSITETPTMDMYFQAGADGNFELSFEDLATLPDNTKVILEDKKLATFTEIAAATKYTFAATAQDTWNRFLLHFNTVQAPVDTTTNPTAIADLKNVKPEIYSSSNKLFVRTNDTDAKSISIYNLIGQEIFTSTTSNRLFVKQMDNVHLGIVIVKVTNVQGQTFSKTILLTNQ
jgi:hypothetical protein